MGKDFRGCCNCYEAFRPDQMETCDGCNNYICEGCCERYGTCELCRKDSCSYAAYRDSHRYFTISANNLEQAKIKLSKYLHDPFTRIRMSITEDEIEHIIGTVHPIEDVCEHTQ